MQRRLAGCLYENRLVSLAGKTAAFLTNATPNYAFGPEEWFSSSWQPCLPAVGTPHNAYQPLVDFTRNRWVQMPKSRIRRWWEEYPVGWGV